MNNHVAREKHHGAIVAAYRVAKGWSQQKLAHELGVDLTTVQRMEKLPMIKNMSRRWFLVGLLGIPAALLDLEGESPHTESVKLIFNADPMTYHENIVDLYWEIYRRGGPLGVTSRLDIWMQEITAFEQAVRGTVWHKRALAVLAMSYQLQGSIARSMMSYAAARAAYQRAFRIAKELDDTELMASALAREGSAFMWEDQSQKAIPLLNGAIEMINGSGLPNLRGSILGDLSEAYALVKQPQACWHSIGLAEKAIDYRDHRQERSQFLPLVSVTSRKGVDAFFLGDYERACMLLDKSLLKCNPTLVPERARILARKADAYYGLGKIDDCVETAMEAWSLASSTGVSKRIAQLRDLHTSLTQSRWKNESGVARLGALLASHRV